jgi:hypothetical protein
MAERLEELGRRIHWSTHNMYGYFTSGFIEISELCVAVA